VATDPPTSSSGADRITHADVRVRFLGVFDTVGSLGIPRTWLNWIGRRCFQFHDTDLCGIVDHACHWEDWSRIHRLAHAKGLRTPATMLYGHIEEPRHRVDHVLRLRELQDETGGFQVFIPLRYQHDFVDSADGKVRNRLQERTTMAAPAESLKTFAVSRLLFDNVPHVKCFWVMHGLSVAQLSLNFGVDDLDGSVVEYKITHDADEYGTPNTMHRDDLLHLIWDAGFRPVERNTRYEVVREYDAPVPLAQRRAEPQQVWA